MGEKLARETDMGALIDALERIADSLEQKDLWQARYTADRNRQQPTDVYVLTKRQRKLIERHGEKAT